VRGHAGDVLATRAVPEARGTWARSPNARDERFDLPGFRDERAAQFARSLLRTEVTVRVSQKGVRRLPYTLDRSAVHGALDAAGPADARGG
jgi:hypothetical protein